MSASCRLSILVVVGLLILAGCDSPPTPRKYVVLTIDAVTLNPENAQESQHVYDFLQAQANYEGALAVLKSHYTTANDLEHINWVEREQLNLQNARMFLWEGVESPLPSDAVLTAGNESMLVENLVGIRDTYVAAAKALADYYEQYGPEDNAKAAASILERYDLIRTYVYLDDAEFPPLDLSPSEGIVEANALFKEAVKLHEKGKGWARTFFSTDYQTQRKALKRFKDVIEQYPTSDKISEAAFYIGDIYKEYFNEDVRAVHWYERAWTWDPEVPHPARFQAATVYDLRLNNKAHALFLYKRVLTEEQFDPSNAYFAAQRIEEIQEDAHLYEAELKELQGRTPPPRTSTPRAPAPRTSPPRTPTPRTSPPDTTKPAPLEPQPDDYVSPEYDFIEPNAPEYPTARDPAGIETIGSPDRPIKESLGGDVESDEYD